MASISKDPDENHMSEQLEKAQRAVSVLFEALEINDFTLSTSLSAAGTLLIHFLRIGGLSDKKMHDLKSLLLECAKDLGANSTMTEGALNGKK